MNGRAHRHIAIELKSSYAPSSWLYHRRSRCGAFRVAHGRRERIAMTKIGIISDTHGLLRPEVVERLKTCDAILHAGDVNRPEILDALRAVVPLCVVRGNNDKDWAENLPHSLTVELDGVRFFMIHNKRDLPKDLDDAQVVVFGHSHKYFEQTIDGRLWINPGSCGKRRFDQEISFAVLHIDGGAWHVEKIVLPNA